MKHKLKWLSFSMAFHYFKNIIDIFNIDVSYNTNRCVESQDIEEKPRNCNTGTRDRNGQ